MRLYVYRCTPCQGRAGAGPARAEKTSKHLGDVIRLERFGGSGSRARNITSTLETRQGAPH